jgi:putative transposase
MVRSGFCSARRLGSSVLQLWYTMIECMLMIINVNFRRKKIRLPVTEYRGKQLYFVTLCCEARRPVFASQSAGNWLVKWLTRAAAQHDFAIHAYCVMPDHVHVLAEAMNDNCALARFVAALKQNTGFAYQQERGRRLWQPRYYDHVLRKPEDTEAVAWYIWLNPVRKGLCSAPQDYPLSGSLTLEWKQRCAPEHAWSPPWKPKLAG